MYLKLSVVCFCVTIACAIAQSTPVNDDKLLSLIDQIDNEKSLNLFGGLSLEKVKSGSRSFDFKNADTETLVERAQRFINSHELKFKVPDDNEVSEGRTDKLKKLALPILLALKFKLAVILPIVLIAITAVSFKGLLAGSLALLFSGATFLKDLLSKKQEHVTTAYISGHNAELHSGWNRNAQAQELAYNNYHTVPHGIYNN